MTKIHFRKYNKSDAKELVRIKNTEEVMNFFCCEETNEKDFDKEVVDGFKSKYKTLFYTLVLEEEKEKTIIGCFIYNMIDTKNKKCYIQYFIDPEYHKNGYGTTMLKLGIELGKSFKLNKLVANVVIGNEASSNILLKNNFKLCGTFHKHFYYKNKFHDLLVYEYLY